MAYFHCLIGGGSSGGGYELTVTCDADFAGTTITCTDGVTTLTQTCPSASPYEVVFAIPNGGEWTISGIISGQTHSASIDIPDSLELHSTPEGSIVLPTDDIQTWLACAGITDKAYTTLNEVLADSTTLLALISDNNASDYLVRSTTWASGITADSTAMTDIGANNYCANTLLADSTWLDTICNSTYFESVLNVKVPTMTSATTPSGTVIGASSAWNNQYLWYAFDGNDGTYASPSSDNYVGYSFPTAVKVNRMDINLHNDGVAASNGFTLEKSVNGSWVQILDESNLQQSTTLSYSFANSDSVTDYRVALKLSGVTQGVNEIQFYGRVDV